MKKLFIVLAILIFASPAMAADFNKSLTFAWDQASTDLPNLKEWGLYVMTTSGGTKPAPIVVAYTTGTGPFTATSSFTVTGTPGATVRRYFVLDAVSKNNNRSGYSNEVFYDFVIPSADVTTPMSLRVTVTVAP
ncbi:exported hypothetical protein [Gammaproteobacteria bacterium]